MKQSTMPRVRPSASAAGAPRAPRPEEDVTGKNYRTRFRRGILGTVRVEVRALHDAEWGIIGKKAFRNARQAKAWAITQIAQDFWKHHEKG